MNDVTISDTAAVREHLDKRGFVVRVKKGNGSTRHCVIVTPLPNRNTWMTDAPAEWIAAMAEIGFTVHPTMGSVHDTDPLQFIFVKTGVVPDGDPEKWKHKQAYIPRESKRRSPEFRKNQDRRMSRATDRLSRARRAGINVVGF